METLTNRVLETEERFMMGKTFDSLAIVSYLQFNNLLISNGADNHEPDDNKYQKKREYSLKNGGKVTINYDRFMDTAQIVLPVNLPMNIAEDLKNIGDESREIANKKKFGVSGMH